MLYQNVLLNKELVRPDDDGLEERHFKEIEKVLTKALTPKQLQHAMKIFRGFAKGKSIEEHKDAIVSSRYGIRERIQRITSNCVNHLHSIISRMT